MLNQIKAISVSFLPMSCPPAFLQWKEQRGNTLAVQAPISVLPLIRDQSSLLTGSKRVLCKISWMSLIASRASFLESAPSLFFYLQLHAPASWAHTGVSCALGNARPSVVPSKYTGVPTTVCFAWVNIQLLVRLDFLFSICLALLRHLTHPFLQLYSEF